MQQIANQQETINNQQQLRPQKIKQNATKKVVLCVVVCQQQNLIFNCQIFYNLFKEHAEVKKVLIFERGQQNQWKVFVELGSVPQAQNIINTFKEFQKPQEGWKMYVYPSNQNTITFQGNNHGGVDYEQLKLNGSEGCQNTQELSSLSTTPTLQTRSTEVKSQQNAQQSISGSGPFSNIWNSQGDNIFSHNNNIDEKYIKSHAAKQQSNSQLIQKTGDQDDLVEDYDEFQMEFSNKNNFLMPNVLNNNNSLHISNVKVVTSQSVNYQPPPPGMGYIPQTDRGTYNNKNTQNSLEGQIIGSNNSLEQQMNELNINDQQQQKQQQQLLQQLEINKQKIKKLEEEKEQLLLKEKNLEIQGLELQELQETQDPFSSNSQSQDLSYKQQEKQLNISKQQLKQEQEIWKKKNISLVQEKKQLNKMLLELKYEKKLGSNKLLQNSTSNKGSTELQFSNQSSGSGIQSFNNLPQYSTQQQQQQPQQLSQLQQINGSQSQFYLQQMINNKEMFDGDQYFENGQILQGSKQQKNKVIYARWFQQENVSLKMLYNIFSLYGNIDKMIYMKDKLSCLVQYQSIKQAQNAKESLSDICYMGQNLKLFYSNYEEVYLKPNANQATEEQFQGQEGTFRFKNDDEIDGTIPPTNILVISRISPQAVQNMQILKQKFNIYGGLQDIQLIEQTSKWQNYWFIYKDKQTALQILSIYHGEEIFGRRIKISFSQGKK